MSSSTLTATKTSEQATLNCGANMNQPSEPSTDTKSLLKTNIAVQPFQLTNSMTPTAVGLPATVCQNILLGNNAKQLIIQKNLQSAPKIGTILTMVENKMELNGNNLLNQNQRFVVTSMPKVSGNRLPVTATTNVVQPKFAFMPVNSLTAKGKVFNVKIADGQMQNDNSSITVMQDNVKSEIKKEVDGLMCEEVIDLDSPIKEEETDKSYQLSIIEESSSPKPDVIEITVPETKSSEKKFQKHGISILKRSFNFPERKIEKPSSLIISPILPSNTINTIISDVGVKESKTAAFDEAAVKTERRRKSNVSYRKDYDEIRVSDWGAKRARFENANITFTELGDDDCSQESKEKKSTPEDMIEIKVVKDAEVVKDDFDVESILQWDEGIGSLPGSKVKFQVNEFGFLEFVTDEEYRNIIAKRSAKVKDKEKKSNKDVTQEEVRCKNCGCFGLPSDFISPSYCSNDCQEAANKLAREKEAKIKRRKKKPLGKNHSFTDNTKTDFDVISDEDNTSNENSQDKFSYPWTCTKKGFSWAKYLDHIKAKSAPEKLFKDPFPYNRNSFRPGMKLEGIDPQHPSYFCVLTVAEVIGYRLRLHFDGYPENYDFWVNSDSMDIFPAGWCEKYGHVLHPPPDWSIETFNWNTYLRQTRSTMAPKHLFTNRAGNAICPNGFRVGMKLEAVDKKDASLVCVASVVDMMDNRILVHFDSWDNIYDYWADPTSPYIHPVGWCDQYGHRLTPPNDYPNPENFTWEKYLKETKTVAAPVRAFKQRPASGFRKGMRLECVDRRVPQLIRVATVDDVRDHQIRISFDGWPDRYSYWVDDDSPDIHPVGWCQKTGHPIEPPLTPDDVYDFLECVTVGCKGQGHVRGPKYQTHSNQKFCPYAEENIDLDRILPDRLLTPDSRLQAVVPVSREPKEKPKPKLGRPPKVQPPPVEPVIKTELFDDESNQEKPKRKYKKRKLYNASEVAKKAMLLADSLNSVSSAAEEQVWNLHSNYLTDFINEDADVRNWSRGQVAEFINSLPDFKGNGKMFEDNDIDGESFLMLTQQDLVDNLDIKLGPAIKLYNCVLLMRRNLNQFFT